MQCAKLSLEYPGRFEPLKAIHGLDWVVPRGETSALVGPSGCGKSTLLKAFAGLHTVAGGQLEIDLPANRSLSDLAVTFQTPALLPWATVEENALLPFRITGTPTSAEDIAYLDKLLDMADIAFFKTHYPHQLSGGMRMRASMVRAFVTRPKLLLMDEPFAALDEFTRERLCAEFEKLWLAARNTAVFVTHNLSEAVFVADRVAILSPRPGRVIRQIPIPLPRPRPPQIRRDLQFIALVEEVRAALSEERAQG